MTRLRVGIVALVVMAIVAVVAAFQYSSAASLGTGALDTIPLEVQTTASAPNIIIKDPFTNTGASAKNLSASSPTIEGAGMAATTTGAPNWAATTGTSGWQIDPGDWAKCGAAGFSAARIPWMTRSSVVQVSLPSVVASPTASNTASGIFMLGDSGAATAVGARLVRNPNAGTSSDRWRFELITLASSTATVQSSVNLFSNSTSNPTAPLTMKLTYSSGSPKTMTALLTDGGSGSWSLTLNPVPPGSLGGNYAGLLSFQASATQFDNFQASMT